MECFETSVEEDTIDALNRWRLFSELEQKARELSEWGEIQNEKKNVQDLIEFWKF